METNHVKRNSQRLATSIAALACTILESRDAVIVDLSTHGAKIRCDPYPQGMRIHLDIKGEMVWGTVQWTEIDRMGVKFDMPIASGALHRELLSATTAMERRMMSGARPAFGRKAA